MTAAEREDLRRRTEAARIGVRSLRNAIRNALPLLAQLEETLEVLSAAQPEEAQRNGKEHALTR